MAESKQARGGIAQQVKPDAALAAIVGQALKLARVGRAID